MRDFLIAIGITFFLSVSIVSCVSEHTSRGLLFSEDISLNRLEQKVDSMLNSERSAGNERKLYSIFKNMPKGALLHIHASALCNMEQLVDSAAECRRCYINWGSDTCDGVIYGQFAILQDSDTLKYLERGWLPLYRLLQRDTTVRDSVVQLLHLKISKTLKWNNFEDVFTRLSAIYSYLPTFKSSMQSALRSCAEDEIQLVELRSGFKSLKDSNFKDISTDSVIAIINNAAEQLKDSYPDFDVRYIYTIKRGYDIDYVASLLDTGKALMKRYPGTFIGLDFLGDEDGLRPLSDFSELIKASGMPLITHAGESRLSTNVNINEALHLRGKRIGHGVNLHYFPELYKTFIDSNVLIESCPISNVMLDFVDDMQSHPMQEYMKQGIQVSLSSDDPAIFNIAPLTDDYFQAYMNWNLSLRDIKKMLLNSITYSSLAPSVIEKHLETFNKKWNNYMETLCR